MVIAQKKLAGVKTEKKSPVELRSEPHKYTSSYPDNTKASSNFFVSDAVEYVQSCVLPGGDTMSCV